MVSQDSVCDHTQNAMKQFKWATKRSWTFLFLVVTLLVVILVQIKAGNILTLWAKPDEIQMQDDMIFRPQEIESCSQFVRTNTRRKKVVSIKDFGGVGDGKTLNTKAFQKAVNYLENFSERNGGDVGTQLTVPSGRWVTGSFNLTSRFTLYLEKDAIILGSQDPGEWPLINALPSYGHGRERPGGRHISLIHGENLENVVITGENGTIDGQGQMWWDMWRNKSLQHTRGHLVEFLNSTNIIISNVTFLNSPFWNIHPIYCRNVVIKQVTILAPLDAPNTDGIDPDSSSNVCIEDCYIRSGDDLVAVKSGWDEYGINMGQPSSNIVIQRVIGTTPTCSGIGIGSEMSGGISDVVVKDFIVYNASAGIRVKTDTGRGGYITNITISNFQMENVKVPIKFTSDSNDHPDDKWDINALPLIKGIEVKDVVGKNIHNAPSFKGLKKAPFVDIVLSNIHLEGIPQGRNWHCEYVEGFSTNVSPPPCSNFLPQTKTNSSFGYS